MHFHKYFVSELVEQVIASRYSMVVHGCKRRVTKGYNDSETKNHTDL